MANRDELLASLKKALAILHDLDADNCERDESDPPLYESLEQQEWEDMLSGVIWAAHLIERGGSLFGEDVERGWLMCRSCGMPGALFRIRVTDKASEGDIEAAESLFCISCDASTPLEREQTVTTRTRCKV